MPRLVVPTALALASGWLALPAAEPGPAFDILIRGGTVYDGSGQPGRRADVGIRGDKIVAIGDLSNATAKTTVDAAALVRGITGDYLNVVGLPVPTLHDLVPDLLAGV